MEVNLNLNRLFYLNIYLILGIFWYFLDFFTDHCKARGYYSIIIFLLLLWKNTILQQFFRLVVIFWMYDKWEMNIRFLHDWGALWSDGWWWFGEVFLGSHSWKFEIIIVGENFEITREWGDLIDLYGLKR